LKSFTTKENERGKKTKRYFLPIKSFTTKKYGKKKGLNPLVVYILASSTLNDIIYKIIEFFKNDFFEEQNFMNENRDSFRVFRIFLPWNIEKLINYSTNMCLKLPLCYGKRKRNENTRSQSFEVTSPPPCLPNLRNK
jgi:hypothetical protein